MKVLIVGGGIAGLVAARALALKGFAVTLLERKAEIADEGGIGIGLQSNAMTALAEIGVARQCLDAGVPVEHLHTYAPDGTLLFSRETERHAGACWPGFTGISRPALHAILVAAARDAGVTLRTGAALARTIEREDAISAFLASGEELSADLVIGADGIYSGLRAQLFPAHAHPQALGEGIWRGLVPGLQKHEVSFIFGGGVGTVGYTPLKGDLYVYVVDKAGNAPSRGATDLADGMARLLEPYGGFVPELRARLSRRPGDVTYRGFETILLPSPWHKGRAVLIGDAAHAGPPTLAQGAAMGIEDAVVLADVLANAGDLQDGLRLFMRRRHARVSAIINASLAISRAQMEPDGRATMMEAQQSAARMLSEPY